MPDATRSAQGRHASGPLGVVGLRGIPGVMGGVETHAEQLYPRLKALRPARKIEIAQRRPYVDSAQRTYAGVDLLPVAATRNKYLEALLHTLIAIPLLRFRCGVRVLHVHAIGPGLLVPLARMLGMRVVLTHHGEDYRRAKWSAPARFALRVGEWLALTGANHTIVVSERLADNLRARFPARAGRIHTIPNGASPTFRGATRTWDTAVLERFGLAPRTFVLAVGRLVPEKGFDDLITAHRASGDPRTLVIAGKADHEDDYARALLDQASDRVIFTGFQSHETLRSLLAATSLFVLPSHHEGLPIAALEAAAMNAPMLLSDIPANLEVGVPAHCYFPVGSVDALAAKLAMPSELFAIDSDAISARYDWDAIARETDAVIEMVRAR